MNNFFGKIFIYFVTGFIGLALVVPTAHAADRMQDDCTLFLTTTVVPTEVKGWDNPVKITVKFSSNRALGYYCSTHERLDASLMWKEGTTGPVVKLVPDFKMELPPNTTGVGENRSTTKEFNISFASSGVQGNLITLISGGAYTRQIGVQTNPPVEIISQAVTVKKNANTNQSQNPPGSGTNNGNSGTTNMNATGTGTAPDTGVTATFIDPDQVIGTFWNPLTVESVPQLIAAIIRILFVLTGLAAVIVIIIAGFRMVIDNGNETQVKKAKEAITWAVVGLIVSILAFSIVAIIQRIIQS